MYIFVCFVILLLAPVLFRFLNALRQDPAVPQLLKATYDEVRRRNNAFLGDRDTRPMPPEEAVPRRTRPLEKYS